MRPILLLLVACVPGFIACASAEPAVKSKPFASTTVGVGGGSSTGSGGVGQGGSGGVTGSGGSTAHGGAGGSTTSTGGWGVGGACDQGGAGGAGPDDAAIVKQGQPGKVLLRGMVVTPDTAFDGEVLIEGDTLSCVAASCAASPGAADATVVETHGIILPGMIDSHNHILFDIFDERHWSPSKVYTNHNQWSAEPRYGAMLDAKQYLNGEGKSDADFGCEMDKWGELKGLVAGTTSIVGAPNPGNRACFGSLSRSIDQTPNGLPSDKVQTSTPFPPSSGDSVCANFTSGKTDAFIVHCGEGVDAPALGEFAKLGSCTAASGCLYSPKTAIVHGAAFGVGELDVMAAHGMSLIWSPRSNVFLYGGGTDYTKTAKVPEAIDKGINVALAPDWSLGGSQNLLDELRFAALVNKEAFGGVLTPKMLTAMVTKNAARAVGLDAVLGTLEQGKKADLFVISGDVGLPYDALLAATPVSVRLVMVGGAALYGDPALSALGQPSPPCDHIDVCCHPKFACVAAPGGTAANKLGQSYVELRDVLEKAVADYDALELSQWTWTPITPVVRCY